MTLTMPDIEIVEETVTDDYEAPPCHWRDCDVIADETALWPCACSTSYCHGHAVEVRRRIATGRWKFHCGVPGHAGAKEVIAWM